MVVVGGPSSIIGADGQVIIIIVVGSQLREDTSSI